MLPSIGIRLYNKMNESAVTDQLAECQSRDITTSDPAHAPQETGQHSSSTDQLKHADELPEVKITIRKKESSSTVPQTGGEGLKSGRVWRVVSVQRSLPSQEETVSERTSDSSPSSSDESDLSPPSGQGANHNDPAACVNIYA